MSQDILKAAIGCPKCIAIIICNEVIEDKRTNNKTLVSLFTTIHTPEIPYFYPRMFVMASLSEGEGDWSIVFSIRAPSGGEVLRVEGTQRFPNSYHVADVVIELRGLPLMETGIYNVDVFVDGSIVATRHFGVQKSEEAAV